MKFCVLVCIVYISASVFAQNPEKLAPEMDVVESPANSDEPESPPLESNPPETPEGAPNLPKNPEVAPNSTDTPKVTTKAPETPLVVPNHAKEVTENLIPTPNFVPINLRPFSQLAHGLRSGPITIVDPQTFIIKDLHYDGKGPDAHFWVGVGPEPSITGTLVPNEKGSTESLSAYAGQDVIIKLPGSLTFDQIDYLGLWCIKFSQNFGHTIIPRKVRGVQIQPLDGDSHGVYSGPIVLVDKKTIFVPNLHFDGKGCEAYFWVGNGTEPSSNGILVPNENNSLERLPEFTGQNVYLRLPDGANTDNIDYFGIWCKKYSVDFGYITIPKDIVVPEVNGDPLYTYDNKEIIRIQKCCPINQVLLSTGCTEEKRDFDPVLDVYLHNATHINDQPLAAQSIRFSPYVNHISCKFQQYPLYPDDDKFSLLQNGSLMVLSTQQILSQDNYCMETVNIGDETEEEWITTAIVCFGSAPTSLASYMFIVYAIGILVSSVFLIITALIFSIVKEVRDTRGKCVIFYSGSMAAAFICLASAQLSGLDENTCATVGFVVQFFLVSSFWWLAMISWETYYKIRKFDSELYSHDKKRLYIYLTLGLLIPVAASIISFFIKQMPGIPNSVLKPQFGKNSCWFDQERGTTLFFYIPIGIAVIVNLGLGTSMKLHLLWFEKHKKTDICWLTISPLLKPMYRSCMQLLILMTICWLLEIVSFVLQDGSSTWIALDILNSLQGIFVFLIFVLHKPVIDKLCICKKKTISYGNKLQEAPISLLPRNGSSNVSPDDFLIKLNRADSTENLN